MILADKNQTLTDFQHQTLEIREKELNYFVDLYNGISGIAAMMVGSASVQDGYLYYSRTQEAAADQSAISLLCKANQPSRGLENFLKILERV